MRPDPAGSRRIVAVLLTSVTLALWAPTAASAHTALLGSEPATGTELAYSPQEVLLSFAAPVSTSTMHASLRSADGTQIPIEMLTAPQRSDAVVFEVPPLPHDVYGLAWESVGDDGHRVNGEVIFGVGSEVGAADGFSPRMSPIDRALDVAAVVGRSIWYVALALGIGAAVLSRTAGQLVRALARRRVRSILLLLAIAAGLRGGIGILTFVMAGGGFAEAVLSRPAATWSVAALLAAGMRWRTRADVLPDSGATSVPLWSPFTVALLMLLVLGIVAGHAPTRPEPVSAMTFGVIHLGAAAAWVGPLALLVILMHVPATNLLDPAERRAEIRTSLRGIVPVAGWALAGVVVSGGLLALRAWDGKGLSGGYLTTLVIKGVVVGAVVVPLAAVHHRQRESWTLLPRSAVLEVALLVGVMVLGGVLVGQDPGNGSATGTTGVTVAQVLDGSIEEPADCAMLEVGRAACYRSSLENVLLADGPQAAIDIVRNLATSDEYVINNCHQVGHDLGNDAAENLPDLSTGLAVQDVTCWSGYIHGFVEAKLAQTSTGDLALELPTFCDGAAVTPYNLTHYNCVHGLGHGVMLTVGGNLFESLTLCERAGDDWSVQSCASGAFMENVVAAQQGLEAAVDTDDLLYPCTAVDEQFVDSCMLMQTSHVLWVLEGDIPQAFGWCDNADQQYQATCYRSMGRDLSSRALLDGPETARLCGLGAAALEEWCVHGAATNAVYDQIDPAAADPICEAVDPELQSRCREGQAEASAVLAAG